MEEKEKSEKIDKLQKMMESILLSDSIPEDKKVKVFEEVLKIINEEEV